MDAFKSPFPRTNIIELHLRYLEELEMSFTQTRNPHHHMYQAPLLYNWKLDELSFVTRVTAILRSALMMGALIPFNINTMSIYSFSGKLLKDSDFIHPGNLNSDYFHDLKLLVQSICNILLSLLIGLNSYHNRLPNG